MGYLEEQPRHLCLIYFLESTPNPSSNLFTSSSYPFQAAMYSGVVPLLLEWWGSPRSGPAAPSQLPYTSLRPHRRVVTRDLCPQYFLQLTSHCSFNLFTTPSYLFQPVVEADVILFLFKGLRLMSSRLSSTFSTLLCPLWDAQNRAVLPSLSAVYYRVDN